MLPAALDLGLRVEGEPAPVIELTSRELGTAVRLAPDGAPLDEAPRGWGRYVSAVAAELATLGRPGVGLRAELTSNLPIGAGLSSSAALEIAVGTALCGVANFRLPPMDLAQAARRAEHRAVGVPSGIMDQAASLLGRAGHAILLDTASLTHEYVPVPAELVLVVVDSGVSRQLERSAYTQRRNELQEALARIPGGDANRLSVSEVDSFGLPPVPARRLRHVVSENLRVRRVAELLRNSSGGLEELGDVFQEAHESLRHDFEATTPELDMLVELAYAHGALAARMTGGGFGGSIVALVDGREAQTVAERLLAAYVARTGRAGRFFVCSPAGGATELGGRAKTAADAL